MTDAIHFCDRCGCEQSPLRSPDGDVALGLVGLCDDCVTEEHLLSYRQQGRVTSLLLHKVWSRRRTRPESPETFSTWVPKTAVAIARDAEAIEALIGAFRLSVWESPSRSAGLRGAWRLAAKKAEGTTKGERGSYLREAHVVCGGTTLHLVCRSGGGEMTAQLEQQDGQYIRFHLSPYLEKNPRKAHAPAAVRATMHALKAMFAEVSFLFATGDCKLIEGPPPYKDVDEPPKAKKKTKKTRKKAAKPAGKGKE